MDKRIKRGLNLSDRLVGWTLITESVVMGSICKILWLLLLLLLLLHFRLQRHVIPILFSIIVFIH